MFTRFRALLSYLIVVITYYSYQYLVLKSTYHLWKKIILQRIAYRQYTFGSSINKSRKIMKTWLVNTNIKGENGNPNGFKYMLRQNKASAYYDRALEVDKIRKSDIVLLYHNDNRIIAVGAVVNPYEGHDYKALNEVEHWVDVNWLWKASFDDNFIPTNYINRNKLGITMVNGTVVNVTDQVDYKALFEEMAMKQQF